MKLDQEGNEEKKLNKTVTRCANVFSQFPAVIISHRSYDLIFWLAPPTLTHIHSSQLSHRICRKVFPSTDSPGFFSELFTVHKVSMVKACENSFSWWWKSHRHLIRRLVFVCVIAHGTTPFTKINSLIVITVWNGRIKSTKKTCSNGYDAPALHLFRLSALSSMSNYME